MAIDVTFYKVAKRSNSTYVPNPDNKYETLSCNLKEPCGIVSPVLVLASGLTWNPNGVNYCHIEAFGRYYFIDEWTYSQGVWICSCTSDPLASWRDTIADNSYYILRTSQASDGQIIDKLYPFYPLASVNTVTASTPLWVFEGDLNAGTFVVGIVGASGVSSYYAMNSASFNTFCQKMFSSIDWLKDKADWGDIKDDVIKSVVNPAQYVTSVMWFPSVVKGNTTPVNIPVGWWEITGVNCTQISSRVIEKINVSVNVPEHPQAGDRGKYLNSFPYRRVKIRVGGFGVCELDPNKITDTVDVNVAYDKRTGNSVCYIYSGGTLLANMYGTIGVPIAISDIQQNLGGALMNGIMGVVSTFTGNIGGAVTGLSNMVSDLTTTDVSQISTQGGVAALGSSVTIYAEAHRVVPEDNSKNGRPYCKIGTMRALGAGFYKVQNGATACLGASPKETTLIQRVLEEGVFFA